MTKTTLVCAFRAGVALSEYTLIKLRADYTAILSAAGEQALGVTLGGADAGESVDVMLLGIAEIKLGSNVNAGDSLQSDANGNAVPQQSGKLIGIALESGTSQSVISVLLK